MNTVNLTLVALFLANFLFASSASAQMSPDLIEREVHDAIINEFNTRLPESRVEAIINPVNPSLDLAQCQGPLEITLPFNSGQRITARVNCHAPVWSLFVTAQVRQLMDVVVTNRPLTRNSVIGANDVRLLEQDVIRLNGDYFLSLNDVIGQQVRRPIGSDQVVNSRMIETAIAVRRGDQVSLESQRGSLVIRTTGIAQEDGHLHQQIRVLNPQSGNEVRAIVIEPGRVRVP
ncbi:MAG: flagellar basal body P-ring formation protein FlgA [Nitrincola sp.]|nr:flagellar basal body P-ring formation protein FlgA [Nitrincola sp.]